MGIKELNKTKKLLYTLYFRYDILPNWVSTWYESGKLPIKVEEEIEDLILGKNFSGSKTTETKGYLNQTYNNVWRDITNKRISYNQLTKNNWIYKRLPGNISTYFKTKSKN